MTDTLFDQMVNITKASAYDAILPRFKELEEEVIQLRADKAELAIRLKGAQQMVQALKDFINEVRPAGAPVIEMSATEKEIEQEMKDHDDLKDINI